MSRKEPGTVVIVGATSAIGRDLAAILASRGAPLLLLARRKREAEDIAADLRVRFRADVKARRLDVLDFDSGDLRDTLEKAGAIAGVIFCVGYLGDSEAGESDDDEAARIRDVNYTGSAKVLDVASVVLGAQRDGYLAALTSVAGDRPRRRVHAYGVAKARLSEHLRRLEKELQPRGVRVIDIRLGPVDTRMPYGRPPQPFMVSSLSAAGRIARAIQASAGTVYVPRKWRMIMAVVRAIPGPLYRRMDL